jgi:cytochrome P450
VLTLDGPPQRELRAMLDPSFRPRVVHSYALPLIEPLVEEHLERIAQRGSAELMNVLRISGPAAFGFGPHFCTGHAFSRILVQLAVRRLFERLPHLRLDPAHPPCLRGWEFRAPAHLHVRS